MGLILRLFTAISFAAAGMAITYVLLRHNTLVQQNEFVDASSYWMLVVPGGTLGFVYAILVLTPAHLVLCWFLQHGVLVFLAVSLAIWAVLCFMAPSDIKGIQFGDFMTFFPLGIVGAIAYALPMVNAYEE